MTSFFRFQKALASWLLQWHVAEVRNLEALLLPSGKFAGPRVAVNTLSQARRHSWGHSQITRQLVNMRQRGPSGRDEDHFLALMALNDAGAGKRQERIGGSRELVLYICKITNLRALA